MSSTAPPLWPQPIPIIGGTGAVFSGKTRFGVSICPGPQTLVYDLEQSSGSYSYIGFERIDVQKEMHARHPNGYKPIDLFQWWLAHVRAIPAGKYRVIMVDPVTDLERGLTDWVAANPKFFGHTDGQYASMSGIMWGDVKDYEKMVLADITARCETFYFTAHIGTEFDKNTKKATDRKKIKGKDTLMELASLYLWFDRSPDAQGVRPNAPTATVIKGRLEIGEVIGDDVVSYSVLPPKLPVATPKAIRAYFANPAGKVGLKESERVKEEVMSADERLRLQAQIAEAERETAQARAAAAASQQTTVAVTVGAKAAEFEKQIRGATDPAFLLETVGPAIKVSSDAGEITAPEVNYLRSIFQECGRRLSGTHTAA